MGLDHCGDGHVTSQVEHWTGRYRDGHGLSSRAGREAVNKWRIEIRVSLISRFIVIGLQLGCEQGRDGMTDRCSCSVRRIINFSGHPQLEPRG